MSELNENLDKGTFAESPPSLRSKKNFVQVLETWARSSRVNFGKELKNMSNIATEDNTSTNPSLNVI